FFFQAEDGIRDFHVTGVQTCALPIYLEDKHFDGLIGSHLLAVAADETVEVLIFKMAVGLGFDCPRAYTLISTRSSRDPDFGVQEIGRASCRARAWNWAGDGCGEETSG